MAYWLDLGTTQRVGNLCWGSLGTGRTGDPPRGCTVAELFPELIEPSLDNDRQPSCSAVETLERQEPSVNPTLPNHALALLVRHGSITYHGAFVNVAGGRAQPLAVNPKVWRGMRRRAGNRRTG